jgi:hypothetical protein
VSPKGIAIHTSNFAKITPSWKANSHSAIQDISRIHKRSPISRPCVKFRNKLAFYGEELLAPRPTPTLEGMRINCLISLTDFHQQKFCSYTQTTIVHKSFVPPKNRWFTQWTPSTFTWKLSLHCYSWVDAILSYILNLRHLKHPWKEVMDQFLGFQNSLFPIKISESFKPKISPTRTLYIIIIYLTKIILFL